MTGAPPKVFISYSHDTVEHQERVLDLADRLRADGIDAEIDQYNAAPPEGWPLWCERQIEAADVVLMICTETYHRRVSGDEERGKGVVWESRIIRQLLYDAGAISDKFVPVLFSDTSPEQIPTPIKGGTWYVIDTEDGYEDLYRRLSGQPRLLRPALGTIRPLPTRTRQWPEGTIEAASSSLNLRTTQKTEGSGRMEPISVIVTALAMGATAAVQKVGGKAVEEAYEGLKKLIVDRFKRSGAVAALAEEPSSETQRKALEEALAKADAAKDPEALKETLAKARELTQALEKAPRAELERALGARIGELEAVNARFGDIDVAGAGTGLDIDKLKATGDATFGNIKVRGPN